MGTTPPSPQPVQPDKPLYKWIARVFLTLVGIGFFLLFLLLLKKVGNFSSPQDTVNLFLSFGSLYLAFVMWIGTLKEWEVPYQKAYKLVYKIVEFFMSWFKLNFDWLYHTLQRGSTASGQALSKRKIWNPPSVALTHFTGRQEFLRDIERTFHDDDVHVQVIGGIKGIGKSRVALQYALKCGDTYNTVLWITASSLQEFQKSCQEITKNMVQGSQTPSPQAGVNIVLEWLKNNSGWLLVLDNCRQPESVEVKNCIALSGVGQHILITSDLSETAFTPLEYKQLPCLSEEEAALLLLCCSGKLRRNKKLEDATDEKRELAITIAGLLGRLPLAIVHAAHYHVLEDFPGNYPLEAEHFFTHQPNIQLKLQFFNEEHWTLKGTWQDTYRDISRFHPQGGDELLKYCAFFSLGEPIAETLITKLLRLQLQGRRLDNLKEPLQRFSFIDDGVEDDGVERTLSLHPVLQTVVRKGTYDGGPQALRDYAERVMQTINSSFPKATFSNWKQCSALFSQALTCSQHIETYNFTSAIAIELLYNTGCFCLERADYAKAEELLKKALALKQSHLGDLQYPTLMHIQLTLGELYHKRALLLKADHYYQMAHDTLTFDPDIVDDLIADLNNTSQVEEWLMLHLLQSTILMHQGQLKDDRHDYMLAIDFYEQASAICDKALATCKQAVDRRTQTFHGYKQDLAHYEQQRRKLPLKATNRQGQITNLQQNMGNVQIQIGLLEPQIDTLKARNSELLLQKAILLNNRAFLCMRPREFPESEKQAKAALLAHLKLGTEDEAEEQARQNLSQALGIFTDKLGKGDINTLECRTHLAKLHIIKLIQSKKGELITPIIFHIDVSYPEGTTEKEYQDIDACFQDVLNVLQVNEKIIGANHPLRAACYNDLGLFQAMQGELSDAVASLYKAERIYTNIDPDHPMLAIIKQNRVLLYEKISKDGERKVKEDLWDQAEAINRTFSSNNQARS